MKQGVKGDWVRISAIVLKNNERSDRIPEDTKKEDLKMWIKGHLITDGKLGERVKVLTKTGRIVEGIFEEVNPNFNIDFGEYLPEIGEIGEDLRRELQEVIENEQK